MENKLKELYPDLFKTKIEYKKYQLLFLSQVFILENYIGIYKLLNFMNIIKKLSLDNLTKLFVFKISNPFLKRRDNLQFSYLFVNEVNNKSVIESLSAVSQKFIDENEAVIFSDIRIGKCDEKTINIFEFLTLKILFVTVKDSIVLLFSSYKYKDEIKFISKKYNISTFFLFLNFFDSILLINITKKFFLKTKVLKIVLMSDVHKLSRIFVMQAKELNIPTFIIQHGATIGEAGYLPIIANKMLVWGESSKKWFVEREQLSEKIEIVGSTRMDSVKYNIEETIDFKPKKWNKVLIAVSEITIEEQFLKMIRDAFVKKGDKDVEIIIKLHPGGSVDYSFIPEKVFKQSGLSYKILRFEDTKILLNDTDIVFVTTSTVGMESIIHNKPIFQYKSDTLSNYRMSYEDFNCSHLFTTSEEICEIISDRSKVFSKLKNYPPFVNFYFFKLDGNSAQRAKEYIIQYH